MIKEEKIESIFVEQSPYGDCFPRGKSDFIQLLSVLIRGNCCFQVLQARPKKKPPVQPDRRLCVNSFF
jgi:hypothetical protein